MIQIPDWVALAIVATIFFVFLIYLVYFIRTRKLIPKVIEFQKEINPENKTTILIITGKGIIKKIDIQITETPNSIIVMIIDKKAFTTFNVTTQTQNPTNQNNKQLKLEINLEKEFQKDFEIFIDNRSYQTINSSGKIYYEIKKPVN
jgi:hypothetical protein